jgi:hypothetical protein
MNNTLPAPRDLPPHRRARIREELLRATTGERRRVRYAPVITAVGACAALALVGVFVASQSTSVSPAGPASASAPVSPPTTSAVSDGERAAIEKGCTKGASHDGPARLHNLVTDAGGRFGLLYNASEAFYCTIGGAVPYSSFVAGVQNLEWLPGSLSVDVAVGTASAGESDGEHGFEVTAGRISDKVTKVTWTQRGQTVTATLANGTFAARIVHPATWEAPTTGDFGVVRAYDAAGTLLASSGQDDNCYVTPGGAVLSTLRKRPDPRSCRPATHWPAAQ